MTPDPAQPQNNEPAPPGLSMTRRSLIGLAGLAGLGGGAWWSWRQQHLATPAGEALPANFWTLEFDTPTGSTLALARLKGRPLLLNFWAPWCPPCVKEMPEFERFHREFGAKGVHVLGLAIDGPTPVRDFLTKVPVSFTIGLGGFGGTELAQALGNPTAGLPFSVMIDANGLLRHRKMGATSFDELARWAHSLNA